MGHRTIVPPLWKDVLFFIRDGFMLGAACELFLIYSNSYDYLVSKSVMKVLERRRMDDFRMAEQQHIVKIREQKEQELKALRELKMRRLEEAVRQ